MKTLDDGFLDELEDLYAADICRRRLVPDVPVFLGGLGGAIFSFIGQKYFASEFCRADFQLHGPSRSQSDR